MGRKKTGYNENYEENYLEENQKAPTSLPTSEQEVAINFMRNEDFATIYVSDTTYMTKLNKLCESNPEYYSLIADNGVGKTYKVEDKSLISFRAKKKEMSEEAKAAASERFKELHAQGKIGRKKKETV